MCLLLKFMTTLNNSWLFPPARLTLSDDEVHIWRAFLDQPTFLVERLAETLSADERSKAERFRFKRDKEHFIVGRSLLRAILGGYLDIEPSRLQFRYGTRGKPALDIPGGGTVRFNVSHSQGLALYAFTRDREIGVDLEHVHPIAEADQIAARFFSTGENAVFCSLPASRKDEAFFNCWTRKEAFVKASGEGLVRALDQFEVSLAPGEPAKLLNLDGDPEKASRWSLRELTPAPGYVAAMAVEGQVGHLRCWQHDYCGSPLASFDA